VYDPFVGPEMKLARARRHTDDFEAMVAAFRAKRPFELQLWEGPRAQRRGVRPREPVPAELPLIIGESFAVGTVTHLSDTGGTPVVEQSVLAAPGQLVDLLPGWVPLAS
jgi:hypothetical protein